MDAKKYDHEKLEEKWNKKWLEDKIFSPNVKSAKNPFYNLMMFPYPSAEGLHVGNMYAFTGADVYGRLKRMQGYDVFEPIGLDGFGIHSENYAIKVGRHPKEHAKISQENFYRQLHMIGDAYDWTKTLETYDPDYYKWTQWLFIKMFKAGLAYKGKAMVNWCPTCKTVLADEQVIDGRCERTGDIVQKREMSSWYFRITEYADRLLGNIEKIDWPEKIKIAQRQWIGKSEGLEINFKIENSELVIRPFTTAHDTIFGATFMVVSPEYAKRLLSLVPTHLKGKVSKYIKQSLSKSPDERTEGGKEKTGEKMGINVINPFNGSKLPLFVADYVLTEYGSGAVMGVPGHDARDHEFAKKYNLPIIPVVKPKIPGIKVQKDGFWDYSQIKTIYSEDSILFGSGILNGLNSKAAKAKIEDEVIKRQIGAKVSNYHLRDWLISRQRYWGPPIPMVNCKDDGWVPVPEKDLPVLLPDIKDFKPKGDGTSPLHNAPENWKSVACPECGKPARRELDVSDTFLDSSWYQLAYPNLGTKEWKGTESPLNKEITKKWLPVNAYIGGAEHAVLHLLYARFVAMVLKDLGYVDWEEPFPFLFGHGLIIKDGAKMSKSKGNIVNPDEYINKFGVDTLRTYLMFLGPYDQGGDFRDTGIEGMGRFIKRVWNVFHSGGGSSILSRGEHIASVQELDVKMHQTIKKVTEDVATFKYNTAIAAIMEYVNMINEKGNYSAKYLEPLALLIAPLAPFLAEEVWVEALGKPFSIHKAAWPKYDPKLIKVVSVQIAIQVDGKLRGQISVKYQVSSIKKEVEELAKKDQKVSKWIKSKTIKRTIFVPGKIINFVLK